MKPVTQTKRGGPDVPLGERGDCFDACLASILEVGIAEVPCPHGDGWCDGIQAAVEPHGYRLVYVADGSETKTTGREIGEWLGPVYWIAGVPSRNLGNYSDGKPVGHVIVMRGSEVVHDPSLGTRYSLGPLADDVALLDAFVLVELEPKPSLTPREADVIYAALTAHTPAEGFGGDELDRLFVKLEEVGRAA